MNTIVYIDRVLRTISTVFFLFLISFYLGSEAFYEYSIFGVVLNISLALSAMGATQFVLRDIGIRSFRTIMEVISYKSKILVLIFFFSVIYFFIFDLNIISIGFFLIPLLSFFDFIEFFFQSGSCFRKAYFFWKLAITLFFLVLKSVSLLCFSLSFFFIFFYLELFSFFVLNIRFLLLLKFSFKRILGLLFHLNFSNRVWKSSFPFFLLSICILVYMRIDQIILSHMLFSTKVSSYFFAQRIVEFSYNFPAVIYSVQATRLNILFATQKAEYYKLLFKTLVSFFIFYLVSLSIFIFFKDFLSTIYIFKDYLHSFRYILILSINFNLIVLSTYLGNYFFNKYDYTIQYLMNILGALFGTFFVILFFSFYGVDGLAFANVLTQVFVSLGIILFFRIALVINFLKYVKELCSRITSVRPR